MTAQTPFEALYRPAYDVGAASCRVGMPKLCPFLPHHDHPMLRIQAQGWLDGYEREQEELSLQEGVSAGMDEYFDAYPEPCPYSETRLRNAWIAGWIIGACQRVRGDRRAH